MIRYYVLSGFSVILLFFTIKLFFLTKTNKNDAVLKSQEAKAYMYLPSLLTVTALYDAMRSTPTTHTVDGWSRMF